MSRSTIASNRIPAPIGAVFGRLTVIAEGKKNPNWKSYWVCRCTCGVVREFGSTSIRSVNGTKSCGCLARDAARESASTHGRYLSVEYNCWSGMIQRCTNPNSAEFKNYGARGITVCRKWRKFAGFYADMGDRPEGMSLDRRDRDGGYNKKNCRWATIFEQNRNTRRNHYYSHDGETRCLSEWAELTGINAGTLYSRFGRGISLFRPVKPRRKAAR